MKKLIVLFIIGILIFGCTAQKTDDKTTSATNSNTLEKNEIEKTFKTSLNKLDDEYVGGNLSKEEYIFYSLQAIYEPAELPSKYAGVPIVEYDVSDEIMRAMENWDSLSKEHKQKILEWTAIPDVSNAQTVSLMGKHASLSGGTLQTSQTYTADAANGNVKVYATLSAGHSEVDVQQLKRKMKMLKEAADDSYQKFKDLLGIEPTYAAHMFIQQSPGGILGGTTLYSTPDDPYERCKITVDVDQIQDEKKIKSTTVHELFHCFQYHIPLRDWNNPDQKWLREATATWSENYIYPDTNREQFYVPLFFETRYLPLVKREGNKEYSDYLFFKFLEQTASKEVVGKILLDAKTKGTRNAITSINEYDEKFAEFSVWNWNKDPILKYTDTPSFPQVGVSGSAVISRQINAKEETTITDFFPHNGAAYHVYKIDPNSDVKEIKIKFSNEGDAKNQRRALVKIGNSWTEEYWTGTLEKTFCLTKPNEKLSELVIVFSNSQMDNELEVVKYDVDTTGECPFEISGITKITSNMHVTDATGTMDSTGTYISNDVLQFNSEENQYELKSRTATCTYTDNKNLQDEIYTIIAHESGSGTITEEYTTDAPMKMHFDYDDKEIDFITSPSYKNPNWVKITGNMLIKTAYSSSDTPVTKNDGCSVFSSLAGNTPLKMSEYLDGNRLHGTKTISNAGITATVEFDYIISR